MKFTGWTTACKMDKYNQLARGTLHVILLYTEQFDNPCLQKQQLKVAKISFLNLTVSGVLFS